MDLHTISYKNAHSMPHALMLDVIVISALRCPYAIKIKPLIDGGPNLPTMLHDPPTPITGT